MASYLIRDLKDDCIFLPKVYFDTQLVYQLIRCTNISIAISFLQINHELNGIERCWGRAKKYARSNCNYSFSTLKVIVPQALALVSIDLIRKSFRKDRDYHRAYMDGRTAVDAVDAVKTYKSHRRVPDTENSYRTFRSHSINVDFSACEGTCDINNKFCAALFDLVTG